MSLGVDKQQRSASASGAVDSKLRARVTQRARSVTAALRARCNVRIDSMAPEWSLATAVILFDQVAHAAAIASAGSDLPLNRRS